MENTQTSKLPKSPANNHYLKLSDVNKQNTIQILFKLFNIKCKNYNKNKNININWK